MTSVGANGGFNALANSIVGAFISLDTALTSKGGFTGFIISAKT